MSVQYPSEPNFSSRHESAKVKRVTGRKVELPVFHERPKISDGEITMGTVSTQREKAALKDMVDNGTQSGAPKF